MTVQETSFDNWRKEVDRVLEARVGMVSDDLPDVDYFGLYQTGNTPEQAARFAVRNAMDLDTDDEEAEDWFE